VSPAGSAAEGFRHGGSVTGRRNACRPVSPLRRRRIFAPIRGLGYEWDMIRPLAALMLVALTAVGCRRDPGRDVKAMTATPAGTVANASEIIAPENVSKSQPAVVGQRIANTDITITYSRPVARGRTLFGGIVPYDEVWNPGADQATAITTTRDITVNTHRLAAGKYSIWMIPRAGAWTTIFSKAADVYHTPYPGEAQDVLRFDVPPRVGAHTETLTFDFPTVEGKDAELQLRWGTVVVPLAIVVP
jgi:hypothetical protein